MAAKYVDCLRPMTITLIENFRAAFYAPFYAAWALGAYEAEGLQVEMKPQTDPTHTMQSLLTGAGEVSWGGPLRLMESLQKNPARKPLIFCEVVSKDPFFLVGRRPNPQFRFSDLQDTTLGVVTEVPTPWMCLQHDLRLAGIDPARITLAPDRSMAENSAALRSGEVDVIQIFQPYAKELELSGAGHVWYAAANRGPTAYTTLNTTREYAQRNPEMLAGMCRALYRTQQWIAAHDGRALAELVSGYFPGVPAPLLAASYDDYLRLKLWNKNPLMSREGLAWLCDAGVANGRLKRKFAYEECVDMRFAQEAMRDA